MSLTIFAMFVVIVWAIKTICKELDVGGLIRENRQKNSKKED